MTDLNAMTDALVNCDATIVIRTLKGDLYDIGKNLVTMMMESSGMEIHDLGMDISPEAFVEKIKETKAKIVYLSALLTTTMPAMKQTVDAIVESGLQAQVLNSGDAEGSGKIRDTTP